VGESGGLQQRDHFGVRGGAAAQALLELGDHRVELLEVGLQRGDVGLVAVDHLQGELLADRLQGGAVQAEVEVVALAHPHAALHLVGEFAEVVVEQHLAQFVRRHEALVFAAAVGMQQAVDAGAEAAAVGGDEAGALHDHAQFLVLGARLGLELVAAAHRVGLELVVLQRLAADALDGQAEGVLHALLARLALVGAAQQAQLARDLELAGGAHAGARGVPLVGALFAANQLHRGLLTSARTSRGIARTAPAAGRVRPGRGPR
jgi:hypothetical protein